jgi:hypothetical protein
VLSNVCVYDPGNVTANFGVNSPGESFSNAGRGIHVKSNTLAPDTIGVAPVGSVGTCEGVESRGTKISYYTPTFGGFQFGISYSPSGSTRNPGGAYYYGTDIQNQTASNVLSVGANFNHSIGDGFDLTAGGAGEWAFDSYTALGSSQADKPAVYTLGFQVGSPGGFAVGADGAYYQNYLHGYYSGAYAIGPGINLEAQVAYTKYDANDVFAPGPVTIAGADFTQPISYDAVEIDGGFAVNF